MIRNEPDDLGSAFTASRVERDRTLEEVPRLESALEKASAGKSWLVEVMDHLDRLESAMAEEQAELHRPDALLALIAAGHPRRYRSKIRNLRAQYDDLVRQTAALRTQLGAGGDVDATEVRHRIGWILQAIRHCRAVLTDLVYDALELDLGEG